MSQLMSSGKSMHHLTIDVTKLSHHGANVLREVQRGQGERQVISCTINTTATNFFF